MEVKAGYKQTEVGVIPEDWEVTLLDLVAKRGSGHTPNKKHPEYWDGDIKWISLRDTQSLDTLYIEDTAAKITSEGIANSSAVLHPAGTVVVSRDAGVGKSTIMKSPMAVSQHFIAWQCGLHLNNHFLYYWLQGEKFEFERIAFGNTIKTIGLPYFKSLKIPLPPVSEQRAIATALSDVDALITSLNKLIAKKRDIKQAAMQELLTGKKRLPGFREDWKPKHLGELGQCLRGVSYKGETDLSPCDTDYTVRLLRSNNVQNSAVVTGDLQFVNSARVAQHQVLKMDDLLICMANGSKDLVGKAGAFSINDGIDYTFGAFMGCFRTNPSAAYAAYIRFLFQTERYRNYIINLLAGSSINNLRPSVIESLEFEFPAPEEQIAITTIIADMDAEIVALERKREKARVLKQGMMQELLTGRIRLQVDLKNEKFI